MGSLRSHAAMGILPLAGAIFLGLSWSPDANVPTPAHGISDGAPANPAGEDPTYYGHIRPMLEGNCLACHGTNGPGWDMTDPEATFERNRLIAAMVTERLMPPWIAEPGHQEYVDDLSLPVETIDMVRRWREAGFPKGEPGDAEANGAHAGAGMHHAHGFGADLTLEVLPGGGSYLPRQDQDDDYRCFVVEWPEDEARYITGFRAAPGNLQVAHHVVLFAVTPEMTPRFRELEEAEEGAGYQCFGGAEPDRLARRAEREAYEARYPDGLRELAMNNFWLAHWAPGMDGHVFPEGTGIRMEPGSAVVVQMHFYSGDAPGEADAGSLVEFQVADQVERPAFHFSQTRGYWLASEQNRSMVVAPGGMATYEVSDRLGELVPYIARVTGVPQERIAGLELHSANLHMHAFGHSGRISLVHPSGQKETLLSVPRWDLRWQRDFTFTQPKVFPRQALNNVVLSTECTFQNPTDREIFGGYGSYDEMCFNFSYIALRLSEDAEGTP